MERGMALRVITAVRQFIKNKFAALVNGCHLYDNADALALLGNTGVVETGLEVRLTPRGVGRHEQQATILDNLIRLPEDQRVAVADGAVLLAVTVAKGQVSKLIKGVLVGTGCAGRQSQSRASGILQRQRHAQQPRRRVGADHSHQFERCAVRADQDVLAVVQIMAGHTHRSGAPTGLCRHLEDLYLMAGQTGMHCSGNAGPSCTDDGDAPRRQWPRQLVRQAIHSLRTGVSEVRWCSTRKPSASISRSSVR